MKKVLLSAALAIVSGAAFAQMTAVEDEVLSNQTGQDGIHIALNVKAHIDAFEWIDNASTGTGGSGSGGSVRFEDIAIGSGALGALQGASTFQGLNSVAGVNLAARHEYAQGIAFGGPIKIDVQSLGEFSAPLAATYGATGGPKTIVIELPRTVMSFNVNAIRVGNATSEAAATVAGDSLGGIRMTNLDFQGTKVAIWGHN